MGRGENVLKKTYLQKTLAFIDSETELLHLKIRYPEQFCQPSKQTFKSDLYIIPKSKGLGIIGMAEIVVGLFLSGEVKDKSGKAVSLTLLAQTFEHAFNFSFGSIYDKQDALFRRKPFNLTRTLDFLKSLIHRKDNTINNR
ncbi:hypothetical protein SAMN05444274_105318 [Mariniphaga anaerophila]|uniref:RteC protein n=1 Tax=Mariniphaga anaerophila TaxID=1484053 RepID=A0A1M5BVK1_9BACT|nr:hypothetical protein [Mariniphaga anaerophila]SHF46307.1 hypothetical protein SAMN05444274_105318 [Mariniphaga anaerophila]